jgi:glycosyltransferase involved in cell wall biosynthesis
MRVVLISEAFSKNMGYLGNMLPRYLSRLGLDVHLVTTDLPIYYQMKDFKETYGGFSGAAVQSSGTVETYDGYMLHRLAHKRILGYTRIVGLWEKLRTLRPDVVQCLPAIGWIPLDAALAQPFLGYKLFTGSHTTASIFPLANRQVPIWDKEFLRNTIARAIPGRFISLFTEKCYGATTDCADIAVRFFGVQKHKIDVCPLGVDTEIFKPIKDDADYRVRSELRQRLGFTDSDIVCIYTGRFSEDKNPLLLAKAVERLVAMEEPFRGLFVGNGVQVAEIKSSPGCVVHPFVPVDELGSFFRAADIGVWPTQESTSMLDAAACGRPIVVNDTLVAVESVQGNGITYKLNDVDDLVRALRSLHDPKVRERLGSAGAQKMAHNYSWDAIAKRRLQDYEAALASRRNKR